MKEKSPLIFTIAGIVGPVFYFILLTILGLLWKGYNPITTGMSEIGAVDSPFRDIMNYLGFSLLGISMILFSFGFKLYFKNSIQLNIAFVLSVIGGIFMFLVGFFPCDPQCKDVTVTGQLHSITSTFPAIFIPLAAMVLSYPISKEWGSNFGVGSFFLGILSLSTGPLMFIESLNACTGLIQRAGITLSLLWIFIISLKGSTEMERNK